MSNTNEQAVNPQITTRKKNVMGIIGFIFSLLALCFGWVPVLGWILLALGFIFSLIGVFKAPRALAITGLAISVVTIIVIIVIQMAVAEVAGSMTDMMMNY